MSDLSFNDFLATLDQDKFSYDITALAPDVLKEASALFTNEQYAFISKSIVTTCLALLRQYHEWLNKERP